MFYLLNKPTSRLGDWCIQYDGSTLNSFTKQMDRERRFFRICMIIDYIVIKSYNTCRNDNLNNFPTKCRIGTHLISVKYDNLTFEEAIHSNWNFCMNIYNAKMFWLTVRFLNWETKKKKNCIWEDETEIIETSTYQVHSALQSMGNINCASFIKWFYIHSIFIIEKQMKKL